MKLIVEIPEKEQLLKEYHIHMNLVDELKRGTVGNKGFEILYKVLRNGIPLDDIKAEIKEWYWQVDKQALAKDPCVVDAMVDLFIRTIDKKHESEEIRNEGIQARNQRPSGSARPSRRHAG